jgi:diguanylate cyclase (GGDEF)-like protein/putative nucleotidyltransferase with HDIG domain
MSRSKTLLSSFHSLKQAMNKGPLAWGSIFLVIVLTLLPIILLDKPGVSLEPLGVFFALGLLPITLASWLIGRRGAIITCLLMISGIFLTSLHFNGFAGMIHLDGSILFSVFIAFLIVALAAGQLGYAGERLEAAYSELVASHENLALAHAIIQKQALTDALTDLPNHRAVMDQLNKEVDRAQRYDHPFSLLFFDTDRFKRVNDTYGHAVGDVVLQQIGAYTGKVLRGGDTLGRFGGEEFVLLLPEANSSQASMIAESIRAAVTSRPMAAAEVPGGILITVSIGTATYLVDGDTPEMLLQQADEAMYLSKRLGRNQVRTATESRQISLDPELMFLLQESAQGEATERLEPDLEQVKQSYIVKMISSLLFLVEQRDPVMNEHSHRVSNMARAIAQEMGLEPQAIFMIGTAALLHDVGKIGLSDALLRKEELLSPTERQHLREHSELGAQILEVNPYLRPLIPAVLHHHERWDGTGYPERLAGKDIPLAARIIGVAEAYDVMLREPPYQERRTPQEAIVEMQRCAGTQFDPAIVQSLCTVLAHQDKLPQIVQIDEARKIGI